MLIKTFINIIKEQISQNKSDMYENLLNIRGDLILAAQKIYNEWKQDEDGYDEVYGSGGICDDIAGAMCSVIYSKTEYGCFTLYNEYDCHTSAYVYDIEKKLLYMVDIPPYVYETGTAYTWRKIKDVEFFIRNVTIEEYDYDDYLNEDGDILNF